MIVFAGMKSFVNTPLPALSMLLDAMVNEKDEVW
jgi:hypothetical protein